MRPLDLDALVEWPELAALKVLAEALAASRLALLAANGALEGDDFLRGAMGDGTVQSCLADAVLNHIDGLENALGRYRDFTSARRRSASVSNPDF